MNPENIKYRAWHKEKAVMIQVSELDLRKKRIKGRAGEEVISARFDEVDIMKTTGVIDLMEKEIYEGDILKALVKPDFPNAYEYYEVCCEDYELYCLNLNDDRDCQYFREISDYNPVKLVGTRYDGKCYRQAEQDNTYNLLHKSFIDHDGTVIFID